jgi:hypothetical protein
MNHSMRKATVAASVVIGAIGATFAPVAFASDVTLTSTGGGNYTGGFTSAVNGSFIDDFTVLPTNVSGDVRISLVPTTGLVGFFTALFQDGQGFGFTGVAGDPFTFEAVVTANLPLELQVFGFAGDLGTLTAADGAYSGTVSISAVPEPASGAMLLAGLAGLAAGAAASRKRRP